MLKRVVIIIISMYLFRCTQTETSSGNSPVIANYEHMIQTRSDSITVAWVDPFNDSSIVGYYELYYCTPNDRTWKLLKSQIPYSINLSAKVYRQDLPSADSIFIFSTRTVSYEGRRSPVHSSSDSTAFPTKWILHWPSR